MAEDFLPLMMFVTLLGLMLTGYPIGMILGGVAILFGFIGMAFDLFRMIEFFNLVPRVWYFAENLQLVAIPLLILMGVLLERSRLAQDLLLALGLLLRGVPGGTALSVTIMGVLFAAITGVVGASVIVMTLIALPPMLKAGYHPPLALGTIAASATLGIMIPPSILLVFLCEMLQISYGYLFAAAIYPGLSLAGLYLLYIGIQAFLKPSMAPKLSLQQFLDAQPPEYQGIVPSRTVITLLVARGIVPTAVLIVLVMGSVLSGIFTVTESAAVGVLGALVLAMIRKRLSLAGLHESLTRASMTIGMVAMLFIGATSFAYVFRILGGEEAILALINFGALDSWGVLTLVIFLIFLMGFFFDVLEILLIALPIFGPIVAPLDFGDHIAQADVVYWFAILVAITLQTSFLTPPMGLSLFYIKGVAPKGITMKQISLGIIPFVLLQLGCVGLVMWQPGLVVSLPKLLFDSQPF
ncbi:MAG: TRAP transporter large permease [Alphaproteobacteria bacterium]|jgi:tripartite ATP-independent transporter DctM subunit